MIYRSDWQSQVIQVQGHKETFTPLDGIHPHLLHFAAQLHLLQTFLMADPDGDYAPQSPDLSAYHSSSYDQQLPQHSYYPQQPQQTYQASHGQPTNYGSYSYNSQITPQSAELYQQPTMPRNGQIKRRPEEDLEWAPDAPGRGSGRKGKKPAVEEFCDKPAPGVEEGIKVSTKFPVARIKRIMQADEDVGKVAQVTPTAVCKFIPVFDNEPRTSVADEIPLLQQKHLNFS